MAYVKSKNWGNISNENSIAEFNRTCEHDFPKQMLPLSIYNLAQAMLCYYWEMYIG